MAFLQILAGLTALFSIAAAVYAREHGDSVRKGARFATALLAAVQLTLVATGVLHGNATAGQLHQWFGHFAVTIGCCALAPSLGYLFRNGFERGAVRTSLKLLLPMLVVGFTLLGSWTGYLMPDGGPLYEETANRFFVLHQVTIPFLTVSLTAAWLWLLRPRKTN